MNALPGSGLSGIAKVNRNGDRLTLLPPPFKIPLIGESCALIGFHRLNLTLDTVEKYTLSIRPLLQGEADTTDPYIGVFRDEIINRHSEIG